jgi:hypothetical protein
LNEIAGYGSSPVIQYNGRGAYFLDKLENGIWRLEVMPDATCVTDPFGNPTLEKEASAIVWNTWPMTIDLPDLGSNYTLTGINKGNTLRQTVNNKQISVSPGTYLIVRKGIASSWKPEDKWNNILLNEFVAPSPTSHRYVLHQPAEEISKGKSHTVSIEIISQNEPNEVKLHVMTLAPRRMPAVNFKKTSRYTYEADISQEWIENESMLNYLISVDFDGEIQTFPENTYGIFSADFLSTNLYTMRIVEKNKPVCLLDVEKDRTRMRRSHRHYRYIFHHSQIPGKTGLELGTNNLIYTSFYFKGKTIGRREDLASKKKLIIRGKALNDRPVTAQIALQSGNGLEYGTTLQFTNNQYQYEIPLKDLRQIRITGPGEKGFVFVDPFDGEDGKKDFRIEETETIKIMVLPADNIGTDPARAVIEYVILE